jgi:hypothetical protein
MSSFSCRIVWWKFENDITLLRVFHGIRFKVNNGDWLS